MGIRSIVCSIFFSINHWRFPELTGHLARYLPLISLDKAILADQSKNINVLMVVSNMFFLFTPTWRRFPFGQTYFIQWVASTIVMTKLRHLRVNCGESETTLITIVFLFFIVSMRWRNNHPLIHITFFNVYRYIVVQNPAFTHTEKKLPINSPSTGQVAHRHRVMGRHMQVEQLLLEHVATERNVTCLKLDL